MGYKFYMQRIDIAEQQKKDLESDFPGLRYKEAKGLETKGKPTNVYVENYADSDKARVYVPKELCREPTEVTLTFVFVGENRRKAYNDFYEYIKLGKFYYWDTARYKKATLVLTSAVEPTDDTFKGSDYILADFVFTNINGATEDVR